MMINGHEYCRSCNDTAAAHTQGVFWDEGLPGYVVEEVPIEIIWKNQRIIREFVLACPIFVPKDNLKYLELIEAGIIDGSTKD